MKDTMVESDVDLLNVFFEHNVWHLMLLVLLLSYGRLSCCGISLELKAPGMPLCSISDCFFSWVLQGGLKGNWSRKLEIYHSSLCHFPLGWRLLCHIVLLVFSFPLLFSCFCQPTVSQRRGPIRGCATRNLDWDGSVQHPTEPLAIGKKKKQTPDDCSQTQKEKANKSIDCLMGFSYWVMTACTLNARVFCLYSHS